MKKGKNANYKFCEVLNEKQESSAAPAQLRSLVMLLHDECRFLSRVEGQESRVNYLFSHEKKN